MNLFKNKKHFSIIEEIKQEISKNYNKLHLYEERMKFIKNNHFFKNHEIKKEIVDRLIYDKDFLRNIVEDDYLISKHHGFFTSRVYDVFADFIIDNLSYFYNGFKFHPETFLKPFLESILINHYSMLLSQSKKDDKNFSDKDKETLDCLENIILKSLLNSYFSHISTTILFLSKNFQEIINKVVNFLNTEKDKESKEDGRIILSHFQENNIKTFVKRCEQDKNDINTFIGFYLNYMKDTYYSFDLINQINSIFNINNNLTCDLFKQSKKEDLDIFSFFFRSPSLVSVLHDDIFYI